MFVDPFVCVESTESMSVCLCDEHEHSIDSSSDSSWLLFLSQTILKQHYDAKTETYLYLLTVDQAYHVLILFLHLYS